MTAMGDRPANRDDFPSILLTGCGFATCRLRRRTRNNVWQRRQDNTHVHQFEDYIVDEEEEEETGRVERMCSECGYRMDVEVI